jgi:hypothetical protein
MPTLVFTYGPREGVAIADFERFLREVDQPITLSLPSVVSSRILRVLDPDASFAFVEILEITGFEEWRRDSQTAAVQEVVARWPAFGDVARLKAYSCEEFYSSEGQA